VAKSNTKKVELKTVLSEIFKSSDTNINNSIVSGAGKINKQKFHILGTQEETFLGVDEAVEMAKHVLDIVEKDDETLPIFLLVDVVGQKLEMRDEWLGMYRYFSHLLKCLHLARKKGHKIISLVYNQAIGGSFIAFGLMADRIYALDPASVAVMWLEAMAKVTKIDEDRLREISKTSPVFAPGVENFKLLGGLHEVLKLGDVSAKVIKTLTEDNLEVDNRAECAEKLGGRKRAFKTIQAVESL
jgi:malonate decarboxylase gamma subunit